MPSQSQVNRFRRDLERVRVASSADVAELWRRVASSDVDKAKRGLQAKLPALTNAWGDVAGVVTADTYDAWRRASPAARGAFVSRIADPLKDSEIDTLIGWALSPAYEAGDLDGVASRLVNTADRLTVTQSDNTMLRNVAHDKARFAWVPEGSKPCAFCQMLAGRGPVYHTDDIGRHDHCSCAMVAVWGPEDLPDGYDPGVYYDRYRAAKEKVGWSTEKVLPQMRKDLGVH